MTTPQPMLKSSDTTTTMKGVWNSKSTNKQLSLKSSGKMTYYQELNTIWKAGAFMNASPTSKGASTSAVSSQSGTMPCAAQTLATTTTVDQEVHPEREVMLPPEHADELLPWYCHWSNELATEMHQRCLVQNKACCTVCPSSSHDCTCDPEWCCEPYNTCFIHDSCFCPSSSSFPPVKPPRASLLLSPPS